MQKYVVALSIALTTLVLMTFTVASNNAAASEQVEQTDCAQVVNARERLACYDNQNPRDPSKPSVTHTPQAQEQQTQPEYRSTESAPPAAEGAASSQTEAAPDTAQEPQQDDRGLEKSKGIFSWPEKVEISSTIAAVRSEYPKKMVFRLENGQIWLQTSPRELVIKTGDKVTIKSGTIGGYILSTDKGVNTRVQRIE